MRGGGGRGPFRDTTHGGIFRAVSNTAGRSENKGVANLPLERRIAAVEEEPEGVAIERSLTLGGTGEPIGAKEAERMRNEFDLHCAGS